MGLTLNSLINEMEQFNELEQSRKNGVVKTLHNNLGVSYFDVITQWLNKLKLYKNNSLVPGTWKTDKSLVRDDCWYIVQYPTMYQIVTGSLLILDLNNFKEGSLKFTEFYPEGYKDDSN
jgi:hypothetical protein